MNCLLVGLILIIWVFAVIICIDINRFVKREYTIYSDKIDSECSLVLLADLHGKEYGKDNYKLISAIKEINPDIICAAGDMLTARPISIYKRTDKALKFFEYLKDYKVYYGIGNHEYRMKMYTEDYGVAYADYILALKELGITVLENDHAYVDGTGIRIQGLMIDREYYKRFEHHQMKPEYIHNLTGEWKPEDFCIMLAHNPEYFEAYAASGADLTLSGHVHGGIMRLPFLGGVISPRLTLFPKYTGGIYNEGKAQMILSRGLGYHTLPLRIFNPGELIHIRLLPCK
ncbi:MAG: metallophosphoesterase [Lachnospiraceae bacterium]|nr:metallophosphoesterase [Lachnospiraceae bacterium]